MLKVIKITMNNKNKKQCTENNNKFDQRYHKLSKITTIFVSLSHNYGTQVFNILVTS